MNTYEVAPRGVDLSEQELALLFRQLARYCGSNIKVLTWSEDAEDVAKVEAYSTVSKLVRTADSSANPQQLEEIVSQAAQEMRQLTPHLKESSLTDMELLRYLATSQQGETV